MSLPRMSLPRMSLPRMSLPRVRVRLHRAAPAGWRQPYSARNWAPRRHVPPERLLLPVPLRRHDPRRPRPRQLLGRHLPPSWRPHVALAP